MIDSKRAYQAWVRLISDEELYEAAMAGRAASLAAAKRLDADELAILEEFGKMRGTKWNMENLRFRSAGETRLVLTSYLPRTTRMLTGGNRDWMQDIVFEYLASLKWHVLGQQRLAECERFLTYVRERISKRRILPKYWEVVVTFEAEVTRLVKRAGTLQASSWPQLKAPAEDGALAETSPRRSEVSSLIALDADISEWIKTCDPLAGTPKPQPITMLAVISSPTEACRFQKLSEGALYVFELCRGEKTAGQLAAALAEELKIEREQVFALLRRWLTEGALAV